MKLALLRFFARRPLTLAALAAAGLAGGALAIGSIAFCPCGEPAAADGAAAQDNPRKILGRGWFDRWPEKRRDSVRFFYFGGGGMGVYDEGSSYRYNVDVFELERQNDKLFITFMQDGKKVETTFTISPCDDKPEFDLCLDLANSPRGPKRYYSWDDDEDHAAKAPWAADMIRDAEARTR